MTRVPDLPLAVPVNAHVSWALKVPSGWITLKPTAVRVPVNAPVRVAVSLTVMIVLPSLLVMLRTVKEAVKLPATNVGAVTLARGIESSGRSVSRRNLFSFFLAAHVS